MQRRFLRFCMVGGSGFVVDSVVFFFWLSVCGFTPVLSRGLAFLAAASWNWLCNRLFTFGSASKQRSHGFLLRQWCSYILVSLIAFVPNMALFWALVTYTTLAGQPYFAMIAGIFAGLIFNYLLSSKLVFNK